MTTCAYIAYAAWAGVLSGTVLFWGVAFVVFYQAWKKGPQHDL